MAELQSQNLDPPLQDLLEGVVRFASGLAQLPRGARGDRNFAQQALKAGAPKRDVQLAISKGKTAQSIQPKSQARYVSLIVDSATRKNAVAAKGSSQPTKSKQISMEA